MTRASFDKARVADKWSEALVAIGSTDGPYSEGGDPQQSAEDLVEQATRILASIALADSSTSGSDARWLRDAGIGAVELINCGTEIILRERLRVSAEGGQSDIYLNAAPDDDEPWQRALSVLSERAEILEIAAMDYTPEMGEIDPDVLGTRMNVFAFPSHSEQSEDEEEIRTSFFSVPDLEDSPIDSWADVLAVWRAHAIDHLPQLIGSKGSQTLWWLSGIGVLALFAQGKAASFEAGFDELTIGVGDLSLEAPDSPIDVGKPESDQLDLGGLESLPGAGALLSSIERIHNFDSTGKARREKKLLRREIPLSVVITSETNQALDPRTGAMAYATALEHLEIAPAPQELDRDAATEFFRAVAGGVSQDGSFVINFEDFTLAVSGSGREANPQGDRDDVADEASGSFRDEFVRGLRKGRSGINITFFDRKGDAEQVIGGQEQLSLEIAGILTLEDLSGEEVDLQVARAYEEAQYEIGEKSVKAISRTLVEMGQRSGLPLEQRLDGIVDRCAFEHGNRIGAEGLNEGKALEDEGRLKLLNEADVEAALRESVIDASEAEASLAELDALVGLESVKQAMRSVLIASRASEVRRAHGLPEGSRNLNAIFVGNAGTGKTTVARMMGEILRATGAVSHGNVREVGASEITGRYTGHAESNMTRLMKEAEGGVLLIDDAYALLDGDGSSGGGYGRKATDQLTFEITRRRPRPVVVILAGYRNKMEQMLNTFNPGLRSRFPHRFQFDDYLPEQLLMIFEGMVERRGYLLGDGMREAVRAELGERRMSDSFENARGVEAFLEEEVIPNSGLRIMEAIAEDPIQDNEEFVSTLTVEDMRRAEAFDVPPLRKEVDSENETDSGAESSQTPRDRIQSQYSKAMDRFDPLIGLGPARKMIQEIAALILHDEDLRASGEIPRAKADVGSGNHMVFVGEPGTGKTTVAEIMAEILTALEIISDPKPVITSGLGLTAEHVGKTKEKVASLFAEARGKLIFIDEAYGMVPPGVDRDGDDYGREAVDEMVNWMDRLRHEVVVVVAGYPDRMEEFLGSNPGLPSRFTHVIEFPNYSGDELLKIALKIAEEEGFSFSPDATDKARDFFSRAPAVMSSFANGRTARDLVSHCRRIQAARILSGGETPDGSGSSGSNGSARTTIETEDVETAESRLIGGGRISDEALEELQAETGRKLVRELELPARVVEVITQQLDAAIAHAAGEHTIDPAFDLIVVADDQGRVAALTRVVVGFLGRIGKLSPDVLLELDGNALQALSVDGQRQEIERRLSEALGGGLFVKDAHLLSPRALELLVGSMTRKDRISIVLQVPDDDAFDKLAHRHPLIKTEVEATLHLDGFSGDS